ncbi:MAG: GGDEF domain-containing protein [Clostridiales Family XIII bacterium]|nr:GGDEF domain-containing protein [Clostridiales Family XIII bacterium]
MAGIYDSTQVPRSFVDSAAVYIYVVDYHTDEILMANEYYARNFGVARERMEGSRCWEFVMGQGEGRCPFCPRSFETGADGSPDLAPHSNEAYNPTLGIYGNITAQVVEWTDGRLAHIITVTDESNERLLREDLMQLAYYDRQMGIPNHMKLESDLKERPGGNYCIIAFDYISLRYINDAYGRASGDALLKNVIGWIKSFDIVGFEVYRVEGDQFCILLDNADMMSAAGLADRIFDRFQEPWAVGLPGDDAFVTTRVAVCVIDGRTGFESPAQILSIIERTLHISKESGTVSVYDQEMDRILKKDIALEISLKNSVTDNMRGFEVFFQPIVDPRKGMWQGVEALARWTSPEFGRVPPLVFIKMAEQTGLINTIGQWVLDTAIGICAGLKLHEVEDFFLDVNLSPLQMSDERLVSNVLLSLQKHKCPGCSLALEITESEEVDDGGYSQTMLERLRALDVKIALDDFGTGYSNFNNLKFMPVGILKTEKQFIDDIVVDDYQQFLSYVLVELAHAADMKLIAEGVETPEQMRELMKNGADYFQGYLFAKPLSSSDLGEYAHKFREVDPMFETAHKRLADDSRNASFRSFRSFAAGGAALREGESQGGPQDAFSGVEKAADALFYADAITSEDV